MKAIDSSCYILKNCGASLLQHFGKLPLIECTLVEDSTSDVFFFDDDSE